MEKGEEKEVKEGQEKRRREGARRCVVKNLWLAVFVCVQKMLKKWETEGQAGQKREEEKDRPIMKEWNTEEKAKPNTKKSASCFVKTRNSSLNTMRTIVIIMCSVRKPFFASSHFIIFRVFVCACLFENITTKNPEFRKTGALIERLPPRRERRLT